MNCNNICNGDIAIPMAKQTNKMDSTMMMLSKCSTWWHGSCCRIKEKSGHIDMLIQRHRLCGTENIQLNKPVHLVTYYVYLSVANRLIIECRVLPQFNTSHQRISDNSNSNSNSSIVNNELELACKLDLPWRQISYWQLVFFFFVMMDHYFLFSIIIMFLILITLSLTGKTPFIRRASFNSGMCADCAIEPWV